MSDALTVLTLAVATIAVVLLVVLLVRQSKGARDLAAELRDDARRSRDEARAAARDLREELTRGLQASSDVVSATFTAIGDALAARSDVAAAQVSETGRQQRLKLDEMSASIGRLAATNESALDRIRSDVEARLNHVRETTDQAFANLRADLAAGLKSLGDSSVQRLEATGALHQRQLDTIGTQLDSLREGNRVALDAIRVSLDGRVRELQESNERRLEEMRRTVDEKLHDTLERRLGESFKTVSDRLEAVHQGLGEMQGLAAGVGDLKRVLGNVKVRGTWAEVQLGAILEQFLAPDQYERNVAVREGSAERVEFAIRFPATGDGSTGFVWLPIDSKFPQEDYARLQVAADAGDPAAVRTASEGLARTVRVAAKEIHDKYVSPPETTDCAVMFLATEGLYAEVVRQPGLVEEIQQRYRVIVSGPSTFVSILTTMRMLFATRAIEQRATEVWRVLGAVKTEFRKFGEVLGKVQRQIETAGRTIEETGRRTRAMERKLRAVEELPEDAVGAVLALPSGYEGDELVTLGKPVNPPLS